MGLEPRILLEYPGYLDVRCSPAAHSLNKKMVAVAAQRAEPVCRATRASRRASRVTCSTAPQPSRKQQHLAAPLALVGALQAAPAMAAAEAMGQVRIGRAGGGWVCWARVAAAHACAGPPLPSHLASSSCLIAQPNA